MKDIILPQSMQRSLASQAEAERERKAKIISADGEFQASSRLSEAAKVMSKNKNTMTLRYLQSLHEIACEKPSTIILPIPIDLAN